MPIIKNRTPKLCNASGYAVIYQNGKRIRLGKWKTPEAETAYRRFVANWAEFPIVATIPVGGTTIADLCLAYLEYAKRNIHPTDIGHIKKAIETILSIFGDMLTSEFSPKKLKTLQNQFVLSGVTRQYVNKLVYWIKAMFRWGVAEELVPASAADSLKYVRCLQAGKTTAPESEPRLAVPDETVERTLPHLLPMVAAMVAVQRAAGMRPSELCRLTVGDIDKSDPDTWVYQPEEHKTARHGYEKTVAFGKFEQMILEPYLEGRKPTDYIFSPAQAMKEKKARDAAQRKSKRTPSQEARNEYRAKHPKKIFHEKYSGEDYRNSIADSIRRANKRIALSNAGLPAAEQIPLIPHWSPYQLRHAFVSVNIEQTGDVNAVRAAVGHKTIKMTGHYNHADKAVAVKQAKSRRDPFKMPE